MTAPVPSALLHGRRILVAEDEYVIALETMEMLRDMGAEPLGPVPTVAGALRLVVGEAVPVDAAFLDANLRGQMVWPLVDALLARGVPVVLTTGYDTDAIPAAYAALPRCEKPAVPRDIARVLERVLLMTHRDTG